MIPQIHKQETRLKLAQKHKDASASLRMNSVKSKGRNDEDKSVNESNMNDDLSVFLVKLEGGNDDVRVYSKDSNNTN